MYISFMLIGLFAMIGAVALWRGLYPKRIGSQPFCPQCEYELTGIVISTCPECGCDLQASGVVHGRRQRRPWLTVGGLVILLLAGLPFIWVGYNRARGLNWYEQAPEWWVLHDLRSSADPTVRRAWTELDRRRRNLSLSLSGESGMTSEALRRMENNTSGDSRLIYFGFVGHIQNLIEAGTAKGPHLERLYRLAVKRGLPGSGHANEWDMFQQLRSMARQGQLDPSMRAELINHTFRSLVPIEHSYSPEWISYLMQEREARQLSVEQESALISILLDGQAARYDEDRTRETLGLLCTRWLGELDAQGRLKPADREQMLRQGVRTVLLVRPRIRADSPLRPRIRLLGRLPQGVKARVLSWELVDGENVLWRMPEERVIFPTMSAEGFSDARLSPGLRQVVMSVKVRLESYDANAPWTEELRQSAGPVIAEFELIERALVTVVPAGEDDGVRGVRHDNLQAQIRAAFHPLDHYFPPYVYWQPFNDDPRIGLFKVIFGVPALPVSTAFDYHIMVNGQEYRQKSGGSTWNAFSIQGQERQADFGIAYVPQCSHVTIILTPSAEAARRTLRVFEYWDGEPLVYKDVPVRVAP